MIGRMSCRDGYSLAFTIKDAGEPSDDDKFWAITASP